MTLVLKFLISSWRRGERFQRNTQFGAHTKKARRVPDISGGGGIEGVTAPGCGYAWSVALWVWFVTPGGVTEAASLLKNLLTTHHRGVGVLIATQHRGVGVRRAHRLAQSPAHKFMMKQPTMQRERSGCCHNPVC